MFIVILALTIITAFIATIITTRSIDKDDKPQFLGKTLSGFARISTFFIECVRYAIIYGGLYFIYYEITNGDYLMPVFVLVIFYFVFPRKKFEDDASSQV